MTKLMVGLLLLMSNQASGKVPVGNDELLNNHSPAVYADSVVTGKVTNSAGRQLPHVSITTSKGEGTTTDEHGQYRIAVQANDILTFSFVGYKSQEIAVGQQNVIDVVLSEHSEELSDFVVVGYGTQKKINLTGAIATIDGEKLNKRHVTNPTAMLEGMLPGVRVIQSSGQPGAEKIGIEVRGMGTYSGAGSNPLVLVDGVPGNMSDLDPNNIASVSVLKDAASAAIYGARAANGVVLVTTKNGGGSNGKLVVSYNFNYGISNPTKMPDFVTNSVEYMELFNQAKKNSGRVGAEQFYPQSVIDLYTNPDDPIKYPNADWASLMFRSAPTMTHHLSVSGGQNTTYNISIGYTDQNGIMQTFRYKKYNARFNLASTVSKKLKIGLNSGFKNGVQSQPVNGAEDAFYQSIAHAPTALPYLPDGSGRYTYQAYAWEASRPNQFAANEQRATYNNYTVTAQLWADLEITKGLHWYTKGAVNAYFNRNKSFSTTIALYNYLYPDSAGLSSNIPGNGLDETMDQTIYKNLYSYLNYDKTLGEHQLSIQAGYSQEEQNYYLLQGSRPDFSTDALEELNAGNAVPQFNSGTSNTWGLQSFFGRFKYNYSEKYLFEANLRYDGSSRLANSNRFGVFPSFSAGWRVSQEDFMQRIKESGWLNDLKIRTSWGQLGNQNIGLYPYQSLINIGAEYPFGNDLLTGAYQSDLNNENITWEKTTMSNIGIDARLFRHLTLTVDAYKKSTTDILRAAQVTGVVGLSAPTVNDGAMTNTGIELVLNYSNQIDKGSFEALSYNLGFNISSFKNKTTKFGTIQDNGATIIEEGLPWNTFYLLQWDGIFQTKEEVANAPKQFGETTVPGDLKFKDINNDGIVDNDDRVKMTKGVFPSFTYGFNLSASWKGFDLYCFIQGVAGQKGIFGYGRAPGLTPFFSGVLPTRQQAEQAWTPENHSNTMPQLYFSDYAGSEKVWNHPSTFLLYNMSYMRIKALQLGYTLPENLMKNTGVSQLRFYVSGDNLFTFTKFPGLDPEKSGGYLSYPQNKILSIGLSAKF